MVMDAALPLPVNAFAVLSDTDLVCDQFCDQLPLIDFWHLTSSECINTKKVFRCALLRGFNPDFTQTERT